MPFNPTDRVVHGDATADDGPDEWPLVRTGTPQWAYGVSHPASTPVPGPCTIAVRLVVEHGAVGISLLTTENTIIGEQFREASDGETDLNVPVPEGIQPGDQLLLRNASADGPSRARLLCIRVDEARERAVPRLFIPAETFARHPRWSGIVRGGYVTDWLGTTTSDRVEAYLQSPGVAPVIAHDRQMTPPMPTDTEIVLDWVPLLEAVDLAGETFTIASLGAGWGRWITAGAIAARNRRRDYRLIGVEAEPDHFTYMVWHLWENGIDPWKTRLLRAAANSYTGTCWFQVGNPVNVYGQSIISDFQVATDQLREAFEVAMQELGTRPQQVPCVDLAEILRDVQRCDYIMTDLQGSEADVLLAHPEMLDERVAMVNIGTHSELIERRFRRHFANRGWHCRYDIPMNATVDVQVEGYDRHLISWGDGVQVWTNPRLVIDTQIPFVVPT